MATSSPTSDFAAARLSVVELEEKNRPSESLWQTALRRLSRDYLTLTAMAVLFLLVASSFGAPILTRALGVDPNRTEPLNKFQPVGIEGHILGTDELGRDLFARLLYGGQVSLAIGVLAAFATTAIGVSLGVIAGYNQGGQFGFIDDLLMWFITTLTSIPSLMLLILISALFNPGVGTLIFILTILSWTGIMRLIRGETINYRSREYVISARALGASPYRIMYIHILPNTLSILLTALAIEIGSLMLVEAGLSFLGLGVQPPTASWGNMLNAAQPHFRQGPHMAIFPGLFISITVLCLYLLGDGLRDAFDPSSRK